MASYRSLRIYPGQPAEDTVPHGEGLRGLNRRELLAAGVKVGGGFVVGSSFVAHSGCAWAVEAKGLKPKTMATLIQVARDIYPHDRVPNRFYAIAVKGHDEKARKDRIFRALIEDGISTVDQLARAKGKPSYLGTGWEAERVALLRQVESGEFFQTLRGGLVVGLYNQKDVWPLFGYEGESFSKGGYVERGFDDVAWL